MEPISKSNSPVNGDLTRVMLLRFIDATVHKLPQLYQEPPDHVEI